MRVLTVAAATIAVAFSAGAQADIFRPSMADQARLGKQAAEQIRQKEKVLPDSDPRVRELRRLGAAVLKTIPQKELKDRPFEYTFDVIESKELNAFALPGGPIFFYTGLLDKLKTEDEIVGILAHEIVHVRNQHWASQYADNLKRKLGIIVVFSVLNANSDILNAADMLDDILVGLSYSRKHEIESDTVGYDMMLQTGYHPAGMVDVFKILNAAGGDCPPEWLSTHPDIRRRIADIEKRIANEKRPLPKRKVRKVRTLASVNWHNGWPYLNDPPKSKSDDILKKGSGGYSGVLA